MSRTASSNQFTMRDPTRQYPRPPFDEQPQSPPGLARDMRPRPDHGGVPPQAA